MPTDIDKDLLMRRVGAYLAVLIVAGYFAVLLGLFFKVIPTENKESFTQMQGALLLAFGTLIGYLYGSSKNSESTARTIAAMALAPPAPPPPTDPQVVKIDDTEPVAVKEVK